MKVGLVFHAATSLLVVLKIVGALDWPWLWVVAPSLAAVRVAASA